MRAASVLLLAMALSVGPWPAAHAQDPALAAAVAPAQVVVDAAARAVTVAISEAERDGTPDEAVAIRLAIADYVASYLRAGPVSTLATHRNATLSALDFAKDISEALEEMPAHVAELATASARCARAALTPTELERLEVARLTTNATGEELAALARSAPVGVDAAALLTAGERLSEWSATFERLVGCADASVPPAPAPAVLSFDLRPAQAWRTSTVELRGVANVEGEVRLSSAVLGLDTTAAVVDGRFTATFDVPLEAPLGPATVEATLGNLTRVKTLAVILAPATLSVAGPHRVAPEQNATFVVHLDSPVPDRTSAATLQVLHGGRVEPLQLTQGEASWRWTAPSEEGALRLTFQYQGDEVVAPAERTVEVLVAPPPAPIAPERPLPVVPDPQDPRDLRLVIALVALLLAAGAAWIWLARRGARPPSTVAAPEVPRLPRQEVPAVSAASVHLQAAFVLVVRMLRRLRLITAATTAREMRPALEAYGLADEAVVAQFERVRYGAEPERADWTERARAWFDRARLRLKEGFS